MKNILSAINLVLIISLFIICFYLLNELDSIKSSNASIIKNTKEVSLDFIFGRIDYNFNVMLAIVTLLFGLFGFLTFIGVKESFKNEVSSMNERLDNERKSWDEHISKIKSVEGDLSFEIADKIEKEIDVTLSKNDYEDDDFIRILESSLVACEYYSKSLQLKNDVFPKFENGVKKSISLLIDNAHTLCSSDVEKINLKSLGYEKFLRIQDNVKNVATEEDIQKLSYVFSRVKFPTLD